MTFSEDILAKVAVFALGLFGFWVARHIHVHKQEKSAPLVCPMNFDCQGVVHSDYSKFLGIPLETLGMIYYGAVSLVYLLFIFLPSSLPNTVLGTMVILSLIAFIFSIYLICVQIFILKKGCFWCFVSALISILIFGITILNFDLNSVMQIFIK